MAGNFYDRLNIAMRHRLLKPGGTVRLEPFPDTNGIGNTEARMSFDGQIYFGPYGCPHRGHDLNGKILFAAGKGSPARAEGIKLERCVSQLQGLASGIGEGFGRARATIPAIGISSNALLADPS